MNKIEALAKKMENGCCAIIWSPENRFYYTGFEASDGILIVSGSESVFLTDSRYIEAAQRQITDCKVEELKSLSEQFAFYMGAMNCSTAFVEESRMTLADFSMFKKFAPEVNFIGDNSLDLKIKAQREKKNQKETEKIKKAQAIAEKAFEYILSIIKEGMTEKEVALKLDYKMLELGAQALSFETIVVSGVNSSMPHGVPSDKAIQHGDFVTMDFGAVFEGYHSDTTRTIAIGQATDEMKKVYNTVLEAQTTALKAVKAGVSGQAIDKIARDIITKAGYGEYFRHATGHGVGVEIHETPTVSARNTQPLEAGNVVTVEPGIYIPGKFGVRIEDMCLVTENGCENFTNLDKNLIVIDK
ncbi:MAG: aminopeptidase P family protein [Clostridiales bacterium]|nr:aminopeptidase P family protein [Clostridiales bacterium]